jgi:hypothetical protein
MQIRLTLKHLSGSRVNKHDILVVPPEREIVLGRDPKCHVQYEETDELVSRRHLKIVATEEKPVRYMVIDLNSLNGTFVNRQRVFGAVQLLPGGHVQLGAAGPEFEFGVTAQQVRGLQSKRRKPWLATKSNWAKFKKLLWTGILIKLQASRRSAGRIDPSERLLALCVPDPHAKAAAGSPFRSGEDPNR